MERKNCTECKIKRPDDTLANKCTQRLPCLSFVFYNNLMFARFFRTYRVTVNSILKSWQEMQMDSTLFIVIDKYNLTEITYAYLNSILELNSQPYNVLQIKFLHPKAGLGLIKPKDDFGNMTIGVIFLDILCTSENNTEWIQYSIRQGRIYYADKSKTCQTTDTNTLFPLKTTTILNNLRNITTKTTKTMIHVRTTFSSSELPSKPNPLLLYLFFFLLALILSIIIIASYVFFRHKKSRPFDQELRIRSSITSGDTPDTMDTSAKFSPSLSKKAGKILSALPTGD